MVTEKDNFIIYLQGVERNQKLKYKSSTISAYANSISLITEDLNANFNMAIESLFDIVDVAVLTRYFDSLFNLPHIIESERIQRKRKTNGFKRYIEFRKFEQEINSDENQPIEFDMRESRTEGGEKIVISKVAERDKRLRKSAIEIHGLTCKGCGFNFYTKYGDIGSNFIEIHHIVKLKKGGEFIQVQTNPYTDLIPLCSNCHRIVHIKRNTVLTIEALKQLIRVR